MINAVLILDKPSGLTSHDVVNRIRRITSERGVGHLGTLDPMATGVLPLVLGRFTRLAQFFNDSRKVYEGEITFGFATDTYDAEGLPIGPVLAAQPTLVEIHRHLSALTGPILQRPPIYSAKKIQGVAAYKLARKETPVEMKLVPVIVHRFEISGVCGDRARFVAEVSAGTYIRSLAHDLGQALGCGAHLSKLRRTQAGEFNLAHAVTIEALTAYQQTLPPPHVVSNLSEYTLSDELMRAGSVSPFIHPRLILPKLPCVTATPAQIAYIRNGRPVNLPEFSDAPLVKVFASQSELFAVAQRIAGTLFRPKVVLG
jgi:tRNA pseudouridine55 synthase